MSIPLLPSSPSSPVSLPVSVVSFDVGGTLIHPHPSVGEVYAEVLGQYGVTVQPTMLESRFRQAFREASTRPRLRTSEEVERTFWRGVVRETVARLLDDDQFERAFDHLYATFAEGRRWRVRADAVPVLRLLRERGYRLVVLSNSDRRFHQVLRERGLTPFFERVFLSAEMGAEKPASSIFRAVEAALGCVPEDILHIGDSQHHDLNGAELAGWQARLLIADDGRPAPTGQPILRSLAELLDLLPDRR